MPNRFPPLTNEVVGITPEGRLVFRDAAGGISSERSATAPVVPFLNPFVNFPTIFGGQELSSDEALETVRQADFTDPETGRTLPFFATEAEAIQAAGKRSQNIMPFHTPSEQALNTGPASLGESAQQSPVEIRPPNSPEEEAQLKNEWIDFFSNPQAQAALLQFGINFGQPVPPGQTQFGHALTSIGAGAEAAGRAGEIQRTQGQEIRAEAREERRVSVAEEQVRETGRGRESRERIAILDREVQAAATQATASFREAQISIDRERNKLTAQEIDQRVTLADRQFAQDVDLLTMRLAAQRELADSSASFNVLQSVVDAESDRVKEALRFGQGDVEFDLDRVITQFDALMAIRGGETGSGVGSARDLEDDVLRRIASNPEAVARALDPNHPAYMPDLLEVFTAKGISTVAAPTAGPAPAAPAAPVLPAPQPRLGPAETGPSTLDPGAGQDVPLSNLTDAQIQTRLTRARQALGQFTGPGQPTVRGRSSGELRREIRDLEAELTRREQGAELPSGL